jgi:hypothetical protein
MTVSPSIETHFFADDGTVPNNTLPLVLYRGALGQDGDLATRCEEMFDANGWPGAWRNVTAKTRPRKTPYFLRLLGRFGHRQNPFPIDYPLQALNL